MPAELDVGLFGEGISALGEPTHVTVGVDGRRSRLGRAPTENIHRLAALHPKAAASMLEGGVEMGQRAEVCSSTVVPDPLEQRRLEDREGDDVVVTLRGSGPRRVVVDP